MRCFYHIFAPCSLKEGEWESGMVELSCLSVWNHHTDHMQELTAGLWPSRARHQQIIKTSQLLQNILVVCSCTPRIYGSRCCPWDQHCPQVPRVAHLCFYQPILSLSSPLLFKHRCIPCFFYISSFPLLLIFGLPHGMQILPHLPALLSQLRQANQPLSESPCSVSPFKKWVADQILGIFCWFKLC